MLKLGEIESHGEYILMPGKYGEAKAQDKSTQNKRTSGREISHTYRAILIWYARKRYGSRFRSSLRLAAMLDMIGVTAFLRKLRFAICTIPPSCLLANSFFLHFQHLRLRPGSTPRVT